MDFKSSSSSFSLPDDQFPSTSSQSMDSCETLYKGKTLGQGAFGTVYAGVYKSESVAAKIDESSDKNRLLREREMYLKLGSHVNIPRIYYYGMLKKESYPTLVMDRLGPSLEKVLEECGGKLSVKTVCSIALQLFDVIEYVHKNNIIHRDLKPANLLVGLDHYKNTIYLTDFGLAKRYIDENSNEHIPIKLYNSVSGTAIFMSTFAHQCIEQSRRDDIQSIAYVLIYLLKGYLPWQNLRRAKIERQTYRDILNLKLSFNLSKFDPDLPIELENILKTSRQLKFTETPPYNDFKECIFSIMNRNEIKLDDELDWSRLETFQVNTLNELEDMKECSLTPSQ